MVAEGYTDFPKEGYALKWLDCDMKSVSLMTIVDTAGEGK